MAGMEIDSNLKSSDIYLFKVAPYIFNILEPLLFNSVIEPFFIT